MTEQHSAAIPAFFDNSLASSLERLSDDEFWALAHRQAARAQHSIRHEEYLECHLAGSSGHCLLPLEALSQVVLPTHRFALLPAMPGWMIGLVAWRGNTLAVVDLTAYLTNSRHPLMEQPAEGALLVTIPVDEEEPPLGLLIPEIGMTLTIPPEQVHALFDTSDTMVADSVDAPVTVGAVDSAGSWLALLPAGAVKGNFHGALVLDVRLLLTDIVQRIGMSAFDE